jgi:hypothetical protein
MTFIAWLVVSLAVGVGIGSLLLAAGIVAYVLVVGKPGRLPAGCDGSRPAGASRPDLRTWVDTDEYVPWRAK